MLVSIYTFLEISCLISLNDVLLHKKCHTMLIINYPFLDPLVHTGLFLKYLDRIRL